MQLENVPLSFRCVKDYLGNLDRIKNIVKAFGLVKCTEGFNDIDSVMNGFSNTIMDVFGERGFHYYVSTVMGTHNLPNNNIPVEIEVIVSVKQ